MVVISQRSGTESPGPLLRREKKNFRWRLNGSESWGRKGYWRKIDILQSATWGILRRPRV